MFCEAGTLTLSPTNQLGFSFTKQGNGTAIGYNGANNFEDDCAANEVLIGYDGRSGNWFDALQAVCALLVVTYK
jgi:hypothetical protein